MKKARMKEERDKEKKKDTEEEAQKEERASDMYFLFVLTASEISELQKLNPPCLKAPPGG